MIEITLEGWQKPPQLHWALQRVSEIFPTAEIPPAHLAAPLLRQQQDLFAVPLTHPSTGATVTVGQVVGGTETDGWMVARGGAIVQELYFDGMNPQTRHLLMSVSKSVVGAVAGALVDGHVLRVDRPLADYVGALSGAGYGSATVRDVLDMRSGIRFSEEYHDPHSDVRQLEEAFGWAPRIHPHIPDGLYEYLCTLPNGRQHGIAYEYRSSETDALGWVCEAVTGRAMADLVHELIWEPIGAEFAADIAVDRRGGGMHDGGISACLRDLVRFGSVFLTDGVAWSGRRVLSESWITETVTGAPDSADVFAASYDGPWM
ncbi:MAG TPA: serine hydrolase, partial [Kineosporiaceae bacterium]